MTCDGKIGVCDKEDDRRRLRDSPLCSSHPYTLELLDNANVGEVSYRVSSWWKPSNDDRKDVVANLFARLSELHLQIGWIKCGSDYDGPFGAANTVKSQVVYPPPLVVAP